ncbi:MAG: YggT family protein [Thermoanaerobaculia bacterium]
MRLLEGFGLSLLGLVSSVITIYTWVIIIRALISWVSPDPYNPVVQILHRLTEPVLRPLRRLVPPHKLGGLDLSPLIAVLILVLVRSTLVYTFRGPVLH